MMENLAPFLVRPISNLSFIFAAVMALVLIAPLIAQKLKLPGIVGLLVAGAVVGPNGLELFHRDDTFRLLGQVGVIYIMFLAGLEIDLNRFVKYKNHSLVFGVLTFLIPQTIGTLAGIYILGMDFLVATLLASMFASHTLLAYPAVSRLGLSKNAAVTTAVGGTVITDTAALLVLAIVLGAWEGDLDASFWLTLGIGLVVYVFLVFWSIPKIGRWFFRKVSSEGVMEYVFVLVVVFVSAVLCEIAGIKDIIGAFLAGLALNRLIPHSSTLMNRIEFVGNALFIPFFLISVGMLVNVQILFGSVEALIVAATMLACVLSGKFLAAMAGQKVLKQTADEGKVVFGLTVAQAAATLAVVLVASDPSFFPNTDPIFDETILNGTILMIAVTCFVAPIVTERYGRKMALAESAQEAGNGGEEAPQRFLVPMAYSKTSENLLDLTFVLREPHSEEPVFPLSVVQDDDETAARVAEAEKMLSAAVVHGAAAEISVVPVTRVAHNPASGIARAVVERRISDLVVGWQGPDANTRRRPFGRIVEQLLDETKEQVMIAHLTQPIATMTRVIAVFPPNIEYHQGFTRAVRDVKRLANNVGALLTGLCIKDEMRKIRGRVDTIKPELASSFVGFTTMEDLVTTLGKRVQENDLVVFLTARRGTAPWSPELEELPARLEDLKAHSLSFLFLSDAETGQLEPLHESSLAGKFITRRVLTNLDSLSEPEALTTLLRTHFEDSEEELQDLVKTLMMEDTSMNREVTGGILLLNARTPSIQRTRIFVATFPAAVEFDSHPDEQIYAIFVALSPGETSLQDHLEIFTALSQLVNRVEDVPLLTSIESRANLLEELRRLARDPEAIFPPTDGTTASPEEEEEGEK